METWILGGTGRSGRAIASELTSRGIAPVLVGRDAGRLAEAAAKVGAARTVVAGTVEETMAEIRRQRPAAVINTIGPFGATGVPIATACLDFAHYADLANDVGAVAALLALHERAAAAGRTVVTGAGFGVTATESVVVTLCQDRPAPAEVRVDMVPSLAMEAGRLGEALAASLLDGLPGVEGGFHLCTTWMIEAYLRTGRRADAEELFASLVRLAGPTGLLPEEYDPVAERSLGNHPQAYSHLGLIRCARLLSDPGPV